ncbi:hypothetical protein D9M72_479340 [compost metagenome]
MLYRPVLALADEGGTREHDRQDGDVGDDVHDCAEPALVELRIEAGTQNQIDRQFLLAAVSVKEARDLAGDDLLDVAVAGKGLAHARRIDIELDGRRATGQQIRLEIRRDIERERIQPLVHAAVHFRRRDHLRRHEIGRIESRRDPRRNRRAVLVDDGDCRTVQRFRHCGRARIDREREGIDDQDQQDRIAPEPPEFLDPEMVDMGQAHRYLACFLRDSVPIASSTGTAISIGTKAPPRSPKPRALEKVPRAIVMKCVVG